MLMWVHRIIVLSNYTIVEKKTKLKYFREKYLNYEDIKLIFILRNKEAKVRKISVT